ncbi:unnamed protein product [Durusdinium trenchii]|uniref:Protein kinase domain-containing protein n=2 Tax=Durusdinium trenchii TaxID=1381693 RepID=A0ABP0QL13_9DINO
MPLRRPRCTPHWARGARWRSTRLQGCPLPRLVSGGQEVPYSPPMSGLDSALTTDRTSGGGGGASGAAGETTDFDKKKKARSTIVEVLDDAAPIVRNRINTVRSTHGDIETRVYTAKRGSAKSRGSAQSGRATTQSGRATTQSGRATTQSTATAGTDGTPPEPQRGSARTSAITQESEGGRGSTQTKRSSMQSRKSTHSSASAMILQGMGLDLRRRGRGSVISHHHGRVHEDFDLLESLGVGGFGEVFRAKRRKDGKLCAIKSVDIEKTDPEVFQRELDQARQLRHPNIVHLLTAYKDEGSFWLVMELYPGGDLMGEVLAHNFKRGEMGGYQVGIPDDRLARYAWQMFSGIAYLHYHKIVHRDIKAENYMRTSADEDEAALVLIDLGVSANLKTTPVLEEAVGTLTTMAHELFLGEYDEKCDMWSIGITLYMCAVCMEPWNKGNQHMSEDEMQDCLEDPEWTVPYDERRWKLKTPEVLELVQQLLQREPEKRPRAREVLASNAWVKSGNDDGASCCFG